LRDVGIDATGGRLMPETTEIAGSRATDRHPTEQAPRLGADLTQAKVLPPQSPVDVPRMPAKPAGAGGGQQTDDKPEADAATDSSWADNSRPAPAKKNARNSNIF
jgi:hypothetical protein